MSRSTDGVRRPRVVIVGGGFAGIHAARSLRRRVGEAAEVVLVAPTDYFLYLPLLPEVAAGILEPRRIAVSLAATLPGVRLVLGNADRIDVEGREVSLVNPEGERQDLGYDRLDPPAGYPCPRRRDTGGSACWWTRPALGGGHPRDVAGTRSPWFVVSGGGFAGHRATGSVRRLGDEAEIILVSPAEHRVHRTLGPDPAEWLLPDDAPSAGPTPSRAGRAFSSASCAHREAPLDTASPGLPRHGVPTADG